MVAESGIPIDAEDLKERAAGRHYAELLIEDEQRLADGIDDILRLDMGKPRTA